MFHLTSAPAPPVIKTNQLSRTDNWRCLSLTDLLWTMVTFRERQPLCASSLYAFSAVPGLEIPCHAQYVPSSICVHLLSPFFFPSLPPSLPPASLASCHPAKVIAIYWAGLICQSQPAILFMLAAVGGGSPASSFIYLLDVGRLRRMAERMTRERRGN